MITTLVFIMHFAASRHGDRFKLEEKQLKELEAEDKCLPEEKEMVQLGSTAQTEDETKAPLNWWRFLVRKKL